MGRWCYVIGRNLYIHLTSRANSLTLLGSRGPLLQWPGWLQEVRDAQASLGALAIPEPRLVMEEARSMVADRSFDSIVFAGDGEATLALSTLIEVGQGLRGLLPLRLNTNGLGSLEHERNIVSDLGFLTGVSVLLPASSAQEYGRVMRPRVRGSPTEDVVAFDAVSTFVRSCVAAQMEVEVTAVEMPGIDVEAVRRLALEELGAGAFRTRSFHAVPETPLQPGSLHSAASDGDTAALQRALDAAQDGPDERDATGNTALIWAADRGHLACVEMLLKAGADANARGLVGNSALHRAARNGHAGVTRELIASGAVAGRYNGKMQTELHMASFYQHLDVVRQLLEAGANPALPDRKGRCPAEDTASEEVRAELEKAAQAKRSSAGGPEIIVM